MDGPVAHLLLLLLLWPGYLQAWQHQEQQSLPPLLGQPACSAHGLCWACDSLLLLLLLKTLLLPHSWCVRLSDP